METPWWYSAKEIILPCGKLYIISDCQRNSGSWAPATARKVFVKKEEIGKVPNKLLDRRNRSSCDHKERIKNTMMESTAGWKVSFRNELKYVYIYIYIVYIYIHKPQKQWVECLWMEIIPLIETAMNFSWLFLWSSHQLIQILSLWGIHCGAEG